MSENFRGGFSSNKSVPNFMEIRLTRNVFLVGEMEEQTERKSNIMKLKTTYCNFLNSPLKDEYQFSHEVGACFRCTVRQN
jgi:hypothetical protein